MCEKWLLTGNSFWSVKVSCRMSKG
jgi:hypothetical protein